MSVRALATRAAAVVVLGVLAGCRWATTPPDDYAAYRAARASRTIDERLAAAARYLEEHPDGAYATEVARQLERSEPRYFAARERSRDGLQQYLAALPRGPHAAEARSRLAALDAQAKRPDALVEAGRKTEARLAAQAAARKAALKTIEGWLAAPLLPAADEALLDELGCRAANRSDATSFECVHDRELAMPLVWVDADAANVPVHVTVAIDAGGRIGSVVVEGTGLVARLASVVALTAIDPSESTDRGAAIEALRRWLVPALELRGAGGCAPRELAGALVASSCANLELAIEVGSPAQALDRLVVRRRVDGTPPSTPPAAP